MRQPLHKQVEKAHTEKAVSEHVKAVFNREEQGSEQEGVITTPEDTYTELVLPEKTLFSAGQYELKSSSKRALNKLATKLARLDRSAQIEIIGHTDSTPPGRRSLFRDNFSLSSARAGAVARHLIARGVAKSSLKIRGMGDLVPMLPEYDQRGRALRDNRAKNRRVHILIKKKAVSSK